MFKFEKKIIANQKLLARSGFEYNMDDKGQFLFTGKDYLLFYDTEKYLIDKSFQVKDTETNIQIAYYELSNWTVFRGHKDKLIWRGQEYKFKKIKPDIRNSLFNKGTRGNFKFQLSKNNEIVTYSFKIDSPAICLGNPYLDKSFDGSIDIENTNPLIAIAGLFLVERALDNEIVT